MRPADATQHDAPARGAEARSPRVAAVVVGRNEACRLRRCLSSVVDHVDVTVFVDSASEDGSADIARAMGVAVVELDRSATLTVGRARNAGLAHVLRLDPQVELVQFVDADSEMVASWFEPARRAIAEQPAVAAVFGQLHERRADRSLYTRLYAIQWDPRVVPDPLLFGGMAMMRLAAVRAVWGFNPALLGAEDQDLCLRLRRAGWGMVRLDAPMAVHEATMSRFGQWWRRRMRGGHSTAYLASVRGPLLERRWLRKARSIWFWGAGIPCLAIAAAWPSHGASAVLLAGYPALFYRIYRRMRRRGLVAADAALYAASCVLAKFPQVLGQLQFHLQRLRTRNA